MNFVFPNLPTQFWVIAISLVLLISFLLWITLFFNDKYQIKIITNKVKKYFGFLLDHGFQIGEVDYRPEDNSAWLISIESKECIIRLTKERSDIYCKVGPSSNKKEHVNLLKIVHQTNNTLKDIDYFMTRQNIDLQLKFYAELLKSHYDQIILFIKTKS